VAKKPTRHRKTGRRKKRARAPKARAAKPSGRKRKNRQGKRKPKRAAVQNVVRAGLGPGFMVTLKRGSGTSD
jgi:hypothetical protein